MVAPDQGCKRPSEGWYCSRKPGHDGPCAARRITPSLDQDWVSRVTSTSAADMSDSPSLSDMRDSEANQCDGCNRGLPLVDGIHRGEGYDMIGCTRERYASSLEEVRASLPTPAQDAEAYARWIVENRVLHDAIFHLASEYLRSSVRPPTDSVPLSEPTTDFKKLLDEFKGASIGESRAIEFMIGSRVYDPSGAIIRIRAARQSIESFVTALTTELEDLRKENQRLQALVVDEAELERIARSLGTLE